LTCQLPGNVGLLEKFVAPDYIEHSEGYRASSRSKQQITAFRAASPTCT
jgi:hypothetical protein